VTRGRLTELISAFGAKTIVVFGDFFLDKYLDFDPHLAEVSLETGKTANQVVCVRHSPGAAGTVVGNLVALGAGGVVPFGFTGDDGEGYELRQDLAKLGCRTDFLLSAPERRTPTYLKPQNVRVPGLDGENERYDTKNREHLPERIGANLLDALTGLLPGVDAVIIADQVDEDECGVITSAVRDRLARMARAHPEVVFFADSRQRIGLFRSVMTKPNQSEAVRAVFGDLDKVTDERVVAAGDQLNRRTRSTVFLTRSSRGMLIFEHGGHCEVGGVRLDGPIDPTGAGDSATAGAVLSLACGGSAVEAAITANLVASITVQCIGTTGTATPEQLPERLELWKRTNEQSATPQ
jgi:rfaE bifunctional protein kinase chain/domain